LPRSTYSARPRSSRRRPRPLHRFEALLRDLPAPVAIVGAGYARATATVSFAAAYLSMVCPACATGCLAQTSRSPTRCRARTARTRRPTDETSGSARPAPPGWRGDRDCPDVDPLVGQRRGVSMASFPADWRPTSM